jgi:CheY-like chemotaxis protein
MNALIVEDEELAVRKLRKLLQEVAPTLNVAGVTGSIEDTVEWLQSRRESNEAEPDLIFLDIELADGQSFDIFERTPVRSTVIFTTSYDEYALQACCSSCSSRPRASTASGFWCGRASACCRWKPTTLPTSSPTSGTASSPRTRARSFW